MQHKRAAISASLVAAAIVAASAVVGLNVGLISSSAEANPVGDLQLPQLDTKTSDTSTTSTSAAGAGDHLHR